MKRIALAFVAAWPAMLAAQSNVPPPRHVEGGMLSNHVYSLPIPNHNILVTPGASSAPQNWSAPEGYRVVGALGNDSSGFQGAIYQNIGTQKYTVVYRGTTYEDTRDTRANIDIGKQQGPDLERQLADARKLTDHAISQYGKENVTVAGHSLGGGIAQVESARTGLRAETYNAPGMNEYIQKNYPNARVELISNNNRREDMVSGVGTQPGYRREYEGTFPGGMVNNPPPALYPAMPGNDVAARALLDHKMEPFANQLAGGATPIDAPTFQPLNGKAQTVDQWGDGGATVRRMEFEGIARKNADEAQAKAAAAAASATLAADPPPPAGPSFADTLLATMAAVQGAQQPAAPPRPGAPPPVALATPGLGAPVITMPAPAVKPYVAPPNPNPVGDGAPTQKSCAKKVFKTKDGCHPGHNEKSHPGGCYCG